MMMMIPFKEIASTLFPRLPLMCMIIIIITKKIVIMMKVIMIMIPLNEIASTVPFVLFVKIIMTILLFPGFSLS